jgi:plasmid stabilization system protein ParE
MPPDEGNEDDLPVYEVRLTEPAEAEVEAAYLSRLRFGQRAADRWYAGLARALETLARVPRGFVPASESDALGGGVRQIIYGKGGGAYRILYRVIGPEGDNPGLVRVLHVRHAMQQRLGGAPQRSGSTVAEDNEDEERPG